LNPLENFRLQAGKYFFRKSLSKVARYPEITNLKDAKTIGIIYNATDEAKYPVVCDFVKYLQEKDKTVKALGFLNYKIVPHYCFPKLCYDYFTRKDLNWFLKPGNAFVNDFINNPFDLLIDLNLENNFPLLYVCSLSRAKYKVGKYSDENKALYDFMINEGDSVALEEYINHVVHYLKLINAKPDEQ